MSKQSSSSSSSSLPNRAQTAWSVGKSRQLSVDSLSLFCDTSLEYDINRRSFQPCDCPGGHNLPGGATLHSYLSSSPRVWFSYVKRVVANHPSMSGSALGQILYIPFQRKRVDGERRPCYHITSGSNTACTKETCSCIKSKKFASMPVEKRVCTCLHNQTEIDRYYQSHLGDVCHETVYAIKDGLKTGAGDSYYEAKLRFLSKYWPSDMNTVRLRHTYQAVEVLDESPLTTAANAFKKDWGHCWNKLTEAHIAEFVNSSFDFIQAFLTACRTHHAAGSFVHSTIGNRLGELMDCVTHQSKYFWAYRDYLLQLTRKVHSTEDLKAAWDESLFAAQQYLSTKLRRTLNDLSDEEKFPDRSSEDFTRVCKEYAHYIVFLTSLGSEIRLLSSLSEAFLNTLLLPKYWKGDDVSYEILKDLFGVLNSVDFHPAASSLLRYVVYCLPKKLPPASIDDCFKAIVQNNASRSGHQRFAWAIDDALVKYKFVKRS